VVTKVAGGFRRALRLLARPVKREHSRGGIVIQPYRGYGSRDEIFLMGRVMRQYGVGSRAPEETLSRDLIDLGRRLMRRGVSDAVITACFGGTEQQAVSDRDGYFRICLRPAHPPPLDRLWHHLKLVLTTPANAKTHGDIFIPPRSARQVVISDIDDTVMYTGVANKLEMLGRLFLQGAHSRVAFPGVAAFYNALHGGVSETDQNPMLYVSRGPWGLYEMLDEFFGLHNIPVGPILFLRSWGLTVRHPFPRQGRGHKLGLIRGMLSLYRDLPFVLIGDSGQRDPEIYAQIVREHPGRVRAVYIRNVNPDFERQRAIEVLAKEMANAGSSLVLAADSFAMAKHAAEHRLISPNTLTKVLEERAQQQDAPNLGSTRKVGGITRQATRAAIAQGELKEVLEQEPKEAGHSPNVIVEPKDEPSAHR
jgi:phosphatidate phosphatase APP1